MMIGDPRHHYHTLTHYPPVYNPPWSDPTATIAPSYNSSPPTTRSPLSVMNTPNDNFSPTSSTSPTAKYNDALLTALSRYLPSNEQDDELGAFPTSDDFRMYEFKVRCCTRLKAHDWTECPFAHPGEKARRRDPRRYSYSGTACTDFRKGVCRRGDACEFAHGVFECWLHPSRYRTQACKDGPGCTRRVCFFAHAPDQLRVNVGSESGPFGRSYGPGPGPVNELVASIRNMQLSKVKSMPTRGSGWNNVKVDVPGSPRVGSGFYSLPTTPTRPWGVEEKMERVEWGRELRARMFEKLSKENPLGGPEPAGSGPDVGWVTELVN